MHVFPPAANVALRFAIAIALVLAIACPGCAGNEPPRRAQPAQAQPATLPATEPATQPAGAGAAEPATQPSDPASDASGQPATQPASQPATAPAEAATQPASAPAQASELEQRQPRLIPIEAPTPARDALAEMLAGFAATALEEGRSDAMLRQAATVLEAAVRLSPRDERLARELVDARLRLGELEAALEALEHYRRLQPDDALAQIRYLDLSSAQMESADRRLEYLIRIAQTQRVPPEVRGHAAAMASLLLRESLDDSGADELLSEAVSIDPYNPQALQMYYQRLLDTGADRARRVDALALLARANVLQPAVLGALAAQLAEVGLIEQAGDMYQRTMQVYALLGIDAPPQVLMESAALQLVSNRHAAAEEVAKALLDRLRADSEAFFADLEAQKLDPLNLRIASAANPLLSPEAADVLLLLPLSGSAGGPGAASGAPATDAAEIGLRSQLQAIGALSRGEAYPPPVTAQTTPQDVALPDVVADAKRLVGEAQGEQAAQLARIYPGLRAVQSAALANLAWTDLYFRERPADEQVLEALAVLAPDESATLGRLRGWQLWRQGKIEAARDALLQVSERDPLSKLALLLMEAESGTDISASANQLLSSAPSGLTGAFLADALREHGARVMPTEEAPAVRQAFATLPLELFGLLEPHTARNFYSILADPRTGRLEYGEPLLLNVSVRNSGSHPITIGPEGVLHPVVRLDALLRGQLQEPQSVPAANAAELWGTVRLDPGEKIEQAVRLDGPQMAALLASRPELNLTISADLTTNPAVIQGEQGLQHVTGAAGQTRAAARVLSRPGFQLNLNDTNFGAAVDARLELLRSGTPLERFRTSQWALGQAQSLAARLAEREKAGAAEEELAQLRGLINRISDAVVRAAAAQSATGAEAAGVAWLKYAAAALGGQKERFMRELLASPEFEVRVVGLAGVWPLMQEPALAERLVQPLAQSDPDATVRELATAVLEQIGANPRPTTAPATGPVREAPSPATQPATRAIGLAGEDQPVAPAAPEPGVGDLR